jgi:bifunctional DNase/RNase
LRDNTFHASITVAQNGNEVEIDSRSSDAIAVAVRAQAPIFAADDVIEESAIEMEGDEVNEEEIVDEFKRFLDKVSAEDFAEAELEEGEEGEEVGDGEEEEAEREDD